MDKYDRYTVGHWLEENLPEFTSIERLHYKVISSLGPSLHNNLINLVMSDALHYEMVKYFLESIQNYPKNLNMYSYVTIARLETYSRWV